MSKTTRFIHVEPHKLDSLPEAAIGYLNSAAKAMDDYFPVGRAFDQTRCGVGWLHLIQQENALKGVFFANFRSEPNKGIIYNIVLLAGDDMEAWKDDIYAFWYQKAKALAASEVILFGRRGWGRIFPDLEEIGTIFRKKMTY
jgi:hypothetical protein